MKTVEDYIRDMENGNVLMSQKCTFREYASDLIQFQSIVCRIVSGEKYHENMRMDEAMLIMDSAAQQKGLYDHPAVKNGLKTMGKLEKEIAITLSGVKGENVVSRTLEYVTRPNTQVFYNVYVTDGMDETELDVIVLTNCGVLILEVKNVKSDLILTEEGRMQFADDCCYDKVPLGEKMELKRKLLRKYLEKTIAEKDLNIPIAIDSFIVFSTPKQQFIRVEDRYRREKYCFRTGLNKKIENYIGDVYYNAAQMDQLGRILSGMESNVKRFDIELNYDEISRNISEAMAVLNGQESEKGISTGVDKKPIEVIRNWNNLNYEAHKKEGIYKQKKHMTAGIGYMAASVLAGLLFTSVANVLSADTRCVDWTIYTK